MTIAGQAKKVGQTAYRMYFKFPVAAAFTSQGGCRGRCLHTPQVSMASENLKCTRGIDPCQLS